jgi:hypothetical protein
LYKIDTILKDNWYTNIYIKKLYIQLVQKAEPCIQISTIRAYIYNLATRHPENKAFLTSFDEIDCILQDRYTGSATAAEAEQISALQEALGAYIPLELYILERYRDFKDIVLKEALNVLLLY